MPIAAMSAATMMALACDEIVMGSHSQLGPIDPQFTVLTPEGPRVAPGQAIIDQFEMAKTELQNPANIGAWLPLLRALLPGLLAQCQHQRALAEEFAEVNLERFMFAGDPDASKMASAAAAYFADFSAFKSHGRRVGITEARAQGLKIIELETDQVLQDLVLSVHHAPVPLNVCRTLHHLDVATPVMILDELRRPAGEVEAPAAARTVAASAKPASAPASRALNRCLFTAPVA